MSYLSRRVVFYLLALWAAVTINFILPRAMPGNPAQLLIAKYHGRLNPQAVHSLLMAFGLTHTNLFTQYVTYLGQLLHGNLGISIAYFPVPVSQVIATSLPWTLFLVGSTTVIGFVLGTILGIYSAWRRGTRLDTVLPTVLTFTSALPYFWLALLVVYLFAFRLGWFPMGHAYSSSLHPVSTWQWLLDVGDHAVLPSFTILVTSLGGWLLSMRNNMISVLAEDYILLAQAKGLPERRVMYTYAARNALLPNLTSFAMSLGFIVGGALLTEIVFSYPGIGYIMLQAVEAEDYPLLQGILLIVSVVVLVANFLADLAYVRLDPRARTEEA